MRLALISLAPMMLALAACTTQSQAQETGTRSPSAAEPKATTGYPTIIRLKGSVQRVDSPEQLQRLSTAAGAEIQYTRPMSGGAHVVQIAASNATEYRMALSRLRASGMVEHAEPDVQLRTQ
jgi:hypothetical protein